MLIVDYQERWVKDFSRLKNELSKTLAGLEFEVEHVGSTAVPGLSAKPIIDLDIVFPPSVAFSVVSQRLSKIGYFHNGNQGIPDREVFKRRLTVADAHPVLDSIEHHLYVCPAASQELSKHLRFRDALRSDSALRDQYQRLKLTIANSASQDRKAYATLKESLARDFVHAAIEGYLK